MSAVKMKIPEDNITTYLTMRSHFKKIYDVRPRVNCWSEACPSKRLLKNTINIRDFQVLPHYCNSTISSSAKKSKQQKYDSNKLSRSPSSKKKTINRNLSYECAYNDDDFGFGPVENNNRTYYSPETHHPHLTENAHKTIRSQQHNPLQSDHPKETTKKKNKFFQNTMDESYQRFLEEMTNEVVRLDLSTDRALKNVFRKHIKHNIGKLDEKKMMAEVMKVQALLDLPLDNDDRYSGIDDMPTLSTNDVTNQNNLPAALKSLLPIFMQTTSLFTVLTRMKANTILTRNFDQEQTNGNIKTLIVIESGTLYTLITLTMKSHNYINQYLRDFDLESINVTLRFCQQEYGDVNCVVWDASLVLAKYLETLFLKNNKTFDSKRVIELGSGLGCVGLAAACFGANVQLTDLPENLHQLKRNVDENTPRLKGSVQTVALTWGTTFESEPYDFLLMADCIYYPEVVEALVKTMTELTAPNTEILICQELRETEKQKNTWQMFLNLLVEHFEISYVPEEEQHPIFRSSDIVLINAKKK